MCNPVNRSLVIGLFCAGAMSLHAQADLVGQWSVGEGDSTASIQFDFLDGNSYLVDIAWNGDLTGREAFDLIETEGDAFDFAFDYIEYSFGDFLTGVNIEDSYNYGEGSPPDYVDVWHYWTADGNDPWVKSMIGFSDRQLIDGSRDAWVFGTNNAPFQIPGPATLALFGLVPIGNKRRR